MATNSGSGRKRITKTSSAKNEGNQIHLKPAIKRKGPSTNVSSEASCFLHIKDKCGLNSTRRNGVETEISISDIDWPIPGYKTCQELFQSSLIAPLKFPDIFQGQRKPYNSFLLFGPPGCGKTAILKSLSKLNDYSSFIVYPGHFEGEAVIKLLDIYKAAREKRPSLIFFDEIDAYLNERKSSDSISSSQFKTRFLLELDGANNGVYTIGITNFPWRIDTAVLRRFQKRIFIGLPDAKQRFQILKSLLRENDHNLDDIAVEDICRRTMGFSFSDIKLLIQDALMCSVMEIIQANHFQIVPYNSMNMQPSLKPCKAGILPINQTLNNSWVNLGSFKMQPSNLTKDHVYESLSHIKTSIKPDLLSLHEKFTEDYGMYG